jgi:hypothetical protein
MSMRLVAAAAAACLSVAGPAFAAGTATASATLSGLQIQLIDLNLDDGVAASISFAFGPQSNQGSAAASWSTSTASQSASGNFFSDANPWRPGSTDAQTLFASATAQLIGNGSASGSTLTASGTAASPGDTTYDPNFYNYSQPSASFSASAQTPYYYYGGTFELSPFTVAVFSASVAVQGEALEGGFITYPWGGTGWQGSVAAANASLSVSGPSAGGGDGGQNSNDGRSIWVGSYYDSWAGQWSNGFDTQQGFVAVSFANVTDASMGGAFQASVSVSGSAYGSTAPIPEPGTWAMMLAGLAVAGGISRRRQRG